MPEDLHSLSFKVESKTQGDVIIMSHTMYIGQVFLLDLYLGRLKVWHAKAWDWTGCNLSAVGELAAKNYF